MNYKLQRTTNYSQFSFSKANRGVDLMDLRPEHRKLRESMREYGFLPSFPIMVRCINGRFIADDGQHRLTFAKELGLEVFFVEVDTDVDLAVINQAQAPWRADDFAKRWASDGRDAYIEGCAFARYYDIPIPLAFSMLAGTCNFTNIKDDFRSGSFQIRNRQYADKVASTYLKLAGINKDLRKTVVMSALWKCFIVDDFDESRIISTAERRPDLITRPSTEEMAMKILEELYNFGRKEKFPLAFVAKEKSKTRKETFGRKIPLPLTKDDPTPMHKPSLAGNIGKFFSAKTN